MGKFLEGLFERGIFASRWLLAPIYAGLIIAQLVFAVLFFMTVWREIIVPVYDEYTKPHVTEHVDAHANKGKSPTHVDAHESTSTTLVVPAPVAGKTPEPPVQEEKKDHAKFHDKFIGAILLLLDMVMVANLLIIILIGGYATFVSKLDLVGHEDRPAWLDHIDPGTLKTKLAGSLVGVSGIHLLQSFISIEKEETQHVVLKITIHMIFTIAVVLVAWSDLIVQKKLALEGKTGHEGEEPPHKEH